MAKAKNVSRNKDFDIFELMTDLSRRLGFDALKEELFELRKKTVNEDRDVIWDSIIVEICKVFKLRKDSFLNNAYSGNPVQQNALTVLIVVLKKELDYPIRDISSFLDYDKSNVYKKVNEFDKLDRANKADAMTFDFAKYDKVIEVLKAKKIINEKK